MLTAVLARLLGIDMCLGSHVLASSLQTIFNQDAGDGAGHGRDHQGTHSQKHSLLCLCLYIANVLKKNNTDHHHHLWQPRALALNTPFLLLLHSPPALSPRALKISHPVSLSLGCPRRSRVVCGGTVKPVRLSSLEVLQNCGARGEASVSASACHRARPRT